MTIDEAIRVVSIVALADHQHRRHDSFYEEDLKFPALLTLDEIIESAEILGTADNLEVNPKYYDHPENWIIDVTYSDRGWKARYEVGPRTPQPICWAD
jgi:hypothetical protein